MSDTDTANLRPADRIVALHKAVAQLDQAVNLVRCAMHELSGEDLSGAVDVSARALYELGRAEEALKNALREEAENVTW